MNMTRNRSRPPLIILAAALAAAACGGGTSNGAGGAGGGGSGGTGGSGGVPAAVSYTRDVKPIFVNGCIDCHAPGAATGYDFANPFDPTGGIIRRMNSWWSADGTGSKETVIVDPGNVANSFLIRKVDGSMLGNHDGDPMPFNPAAVTQPEVDAITRWITDGAKNDAYFTANVAPIFGTEVTVAPSRAGRCSYCHYPNAPSGMSVINVFDATTGMVNRTGRYVMKVVAPGDPNNSSLIKKLTGATLGAQMPLRKARLTADQVEILRKWVTAGALNN